MKHDLISSYIEFSPISSIKTLEDAIYGVAGLFEASELVIPPIIHIRKLISNILDRLYNQRSLDNKYEVFYVILRIGEICLIFKKIIGTDFQRFGFSLVSISPPSDGHYVIDACISREEKGETHESISKGPSIWCHLSDRESDRRLCIELI